MTAQIQASGWQVAKDGDGWVVRRDGAQGAESRHGSLAEAGLAAKRLASGHGGGTVTVLRSDGSAALTHTAAGETVIHRSGGDDLAVPRRADGGEEGEDDTVDDWD